MSNEWVEYIDQFNMGVVTAAGRIRLDRFGIWRNGDDRITANIAESVLNQWALERLMDYVLNHHVGIIKITRRKEGKLNALTIIVENNLAIIEVLADTTSEMFVDAVRKLDERESEAGDG